MGPKSGLEAGGRQARVKVCMTPACLAPKGPSDAGLRREACSVVDHTLESGHCRALGAKFPGPRAPGRPTACPCLSRDTSDMVIVSSVALGALRAALRV